MKDSPNLDVLRAAAVSLVVVSHVLLLLTNGADLAHYNLHTMGRLGVAIFFVHTMFVLLSSLERRSESAAAFLVRRAFRIYPLSLTVVGLLALLQLVAHVPIDTGKVISNLLLIQNVTDYDSMPNALWTLPYEVQMYLALPALYALTRTRRPLMWISLLLGISILLALAAGARMQLGIDLGAKLTRFIPCFLPGLLAFALPRRTASPAFLFAVVAVSIIVVPALVSAGVPELYALWAMCLGLGLAIPACRPMRSGTVASAGKLIATYSYGIYITHDLALGVLAGGPGLGQWALLLVLLPGLAYVAYHGIEKRGIALGARLAEAITARESRRPARGQSVPPLPVPGRPAR